MVEIVVDSENNNTAKSSGQLDTVFAELQRRFKALQTAEKRDELTEEMVEDGIHLIIESVPLPEEAKDTDATVIEPIQLRVLTQCLKCLAQFCTHSFEIRELCQTTGVLERCVKVTEWCLENGGQSSEDIKAKIVFNVRSVLRLACNMVTEAAEGSTIREETLTLIT